MFIVARQLNTHPSASHKSRLKATHTQPQDTHRSTQGCGARLRSTLVQSMPAKNASCIWERRIRRTTSSNFKTQCTPKDFSIWRILTKHLSPSFVDGAPPESWSEHVSPRAGTTHFFAVTFIQESDQSCHIRPHFARFILPLVLQAPGRLFHPNITFFVDRNGTNTGRLALRHRSCVASLGRTEICLKKRKCVRR